LIKVEKTFSSSLSVKHDEFLEKREEEEALSNFFWLHCLSEKRFSGSFYLNNSVLLKREKFLRNLIQTKLF